LLLNLNKTVAISIAVKISAAASLSSGKIEDAITRTLALQMAIASLRLELSPAPTLQNLCLTDYA
jgi:hypothetical protein